jgi:hypothetical protein
LWEAIKLTVNPPPGMSEIERTRQATKIIATVVTTSLGLLLEKSIESFILSIPILAPLADTIAPALTAILTGIMTALVIFAIDRFFDWLHSSGTEMLDGQIASFEASAVVIDKIALMLGSQFQNSRHYQLCIEQYQQIEVDLAKSAESLERTVVYAEMSISSRQTSIETFERQFPALKRMDDEFDELLQNYQLKQ